MQKSQGKQENKSATTTPRTKTLKTSGMAGTLGAEHLAMWLQPQSKFNVFTNCGCALPRAASNIFVHVPNKMWEVASSQK